MATHVIYKLGPFAIPGLSRDRHVRVYLPDARGYKEGDDLLWHPDPYGHHSEQAWRERAPHALERLFTGIHGDYAGEPVTDDHEPAESAEPPRSGESAIQAA